MEGEQQQHIYKNTTARTPCLNYRRGIQLKYCISIGLYKGYKEIKTYMEGFLITEGRHLHQGRNRVVIFAGISTVIFKAKFSLQ